MSVVARSARLRTGLAPAVVAACMMHIVAPCAQGQEVSPLPRIAVDEPISEALPRLILPRRCRSPIWSGWPAPSAIGRSKSGWPLTSPARCLCGWRSRRPVTVDGVEPWRAALQDLLMRHRDGIAILEVQGLAPTRSSPRLRSDWPPPKRGPRANRYGSRSMARSCRRPECARRSLHLGPRAVCRSPGAAGGRPARPPRLPTF